MVKLGLAGIVCAVLVVAAWAAESLTAAIPQATQFTITGVAVPGTDGAVLTISTPTEEWECVVIGSDGTILVDGAIIGTTDPGLVHTMRLDCFVPAPHQLTVQVQISNDGAMWSNPATFTYEYPVPTVTGLSGTSVSSLTAR